MQCMNRCTRFNGMTIITGGQDRPSIPRVPGTREHFCSPSVKIHPMYRFPFLVTPLYSIYNCQTTDKHINNHLQVLTSFQTRRQMMPQFDLKNIPTTTRKHQSTGWHGAQTVPFFFVSFWQPKYAHVRFASSSSIRTMLVPADYD